MADIATGEKVSLLRKNAREAFITFEHKEGSRLVHEKYVFLVRLHRIRKDACARAESGCRDLPTILRTIGINPTEQQLTSITELV